MGPLKQKKEQWMRGVSQFIYKLLKKHVEDKKIKILKKKR